MQVAEFFASLGLFVNEKSFAAGEKALGGVRSGVLKLGAAIGGALGVHALEEMVLGTVDLGGQLNDTSQKVGIAADQLQFYGYVAKLNSGSMEGLARTVQFLARNLDEAQKGTGEAADGLKALGISVNDPKFKNLTVDQKFEAIAKKLAAMPDGAKKTAIAMQVFGRAGAELIPTLNDLGKNADKLHEDFEAFGGALTNEQVGQLDDFGDSIDRMKVQLGQLKNQAVVAVLPLLQDALQSFTEWVKENKETIMGGLRAAIYAVVEVLKILGETFMFLAKHKDFAEALAIIGAAMYAWFNPIQALIVALIAIIHYWPQIARAARSAWQSVKNAIAEAWDWIKSIPIRIAGAFLRAWESIKSAAKAAFEWILNLPVIKQLVQLYKYFTTRNESDVQRAKNLGDAKKELDDAFKSGDSNRIRQAQLGVDKAMLPGMTGIFAYQQQQKIAQEQAVQSMLGGKGGSTSITTIGDVNVTVPPGTDADGIGKAVRSHMQQMLNQAHDAVKGGVK